jgi:hypothetical protein
LHWFQSPTGQNFPYFPYIPQGHCTKGGKLRAAAERWPKHKHRRVRFNREAAVISRLTKLRGREPVIGRHWGLFARCERVPGTARGATQRIFGRQRNDFLSNL